MKPMDCRRCAYCHNPSCEGCDNTVNLTREDLKRLEARVEIISWIFRISADAEKLEDVLLNDDDPIFQGMNNLLGEIKDSLRMVVDTLEGRMEDAYGYEEDKS